MIHFYTHCRNVPYGGVFVGSQGEKNAGFDVLYHNMKHGQIAAKELAEFVRERAAIEETYSKSMSKLAKMASNGSPLGTFAPMWDVFRVSSDKLALCHLELMRKMNDLIRDINKYSEEQVKIHRKTKEEVIGTLESVQSLQVQNGHLQKAREGYHSKCTELERQRKEGVPQKELEKAELKSKKAAESFAGSIEKFNRAGRDFEQKMSESAQKFQDIEEAHLRQMKLLIKAYSHSIEDTHVQVGQVHEEFKQNVENIGIENLIQKFTEQKGTGKERPGPVGFEEYLSPLVSENSKKSRAKNSPLEVDDEGFVIRADFNQNDILKNKPSGEGNFYSSDSDFDDDEPKKFHIKIRPVASGNRSNSAANELELKATVGALTLPPNRAVRSGRSEGEGESVPQRGWSHSFPSSHLCRLSSTASGSDALFGPPLESAFKSHSFAGRQQLQNAFAASESFSSDSSSPENVEDSGLDSPSHQPLGASPEPTGWAAWPSTQSKDSVNLSRSSDPFFAAFRDPSPGRSPLPQDDATNAWPSNLRSPLSQHGFRQDSTERLALAPPRSVRSKRSSGRLSVFVLISSFWTFLNIMLNCDPAGLSRGPSPISLSTQESWPVAAAITEYINAYFKGGEHNRCLVKITGDLTMSFPAGIIRIFTANPNAPVLSFRLVNISRVDHFLPNQKLLYSDPSQSDPDTKDFWFNMPALTLHLQREAELNPQASYYNVALLKYQASSQDPGRAPLLLSAECQRSGTVTRVSLDYHCCPATAPATQLTSVQVLLPLDHTATDLQCQPPASWNTEERRLLWKLSNLSPTNHRSGTLCASWQCLEVPRGPPPSLAVQFVGSGSSLSGLDVELVGSRYRMSLVKKRFATGGGQTYFFGC
uniref:FCH and mu domain containing endocytic adaptor 1 n=1 Tax=Cyprinus carpio TaxID=7962 RepID=A0A8C2HU67_CYPCA